MTIGERSKIIHTKIWNINQLINSMDKNKNIKELDEETLNQIETLLHNRLKQLKEDLQEV